MREKMGSASAVAPAGAARLKSEDDREFKARWIKFGMALKGRADGYGIDWRTMSFEKLINAVGFADDFAEYNEGEIEHA